MRDFLFVGSEYEFCGKGHHDEKCQIQSGEEEEVLFRFLRMENAKFAEGDQACKRSDQSARAADVDTQKKGRVIRGEFGQENIRKEL